MLLFFRIAPIQFKLREICGFHNKDFPARASMCIYNHQEEFHEEIRLVPFSHDQTAVCLPTVTFLFFNYSQFFNYSVSFW